MPDRPKRSTDRVGKRLEEIRTFIPRELIGDVGVGAASSVAWADFRRRVSRPVAGFEFRLDAASPAADFFVVIRPRGEATRPSLHSAGNGRTEPTRRQRRSPGTSFGWSPGTGRSRGDSVADWNNGMTLEYDVAEVVGDPAPGVFSEAAAYAQSGTEVPRITAIRGPRRPELPQRWGGSRTKRSSERWRGPSAHCRPAARSPISGGLPGRRPRAVRLLVQRIARTEVPEFLERAQWPGAVDDVVTVLDDFGELYRRFRLSVDVSARGTAPRLGVEMFVGDNWDREDDWLKTDIGQWRPMVAAAGGSRLVSSGESPWSARVAQAPATVWREGRPSPLYGNQSRQTPDRARSDTRQGVHRSALRAGPAEG